MHNSPCTSFSIPLKSSPKLSSSVSSGRESVRQPGSWSCDDGSTVNYRAHYNISKLGEVACDFASFSWSTSSSTIAAAIPEVSNILDLLICIAYCYRRWKYLGPVKEDGVVLFFLYLSFTYCRGSMGISRTESSALNQLRAALTSWWLSYYPTHMRR